MKKTKPEYKIKKCDVCNGKGTIKEIVDTPGSFDVKLAITASFQFDWNDAGDSTAKETERDLRSMFTRAVFADQIDDELNTYPAKLKYKLDVNVKKLK